MEQLRDKLGLTPLAERLVHGIGIMGVGRMIPWQIASQRGQSTGPRCLNVGGSQRHERFLAEMHLDFSMATSIDFDGVYI